MPILLYIGVAVAAYLIGSVNPAIILSNKLYNTDVRLQGSHNPGFTNFKRLFGAKNAYFVFLIDLLKGIIVALSGQKLFGAVVDQAQFGAAYALAFAMLGHAFPVWYNFQGGKCVAVWAGAIWFIDWRGGLIALGLWIVLMLITRFMSLSVLAGTTVGTAAVFVFGWYEQLSAAILLAATVAFLYWRHRENLVRLCRGTESRFALHDKKS